MNLSFNSHFRTSRPGSSRTMGYVLLAAALLALAGPIGCKNKKKMAEEQARQEQAAAQARADREIAALKSELQSMIDRPARDFDELTQKERRLQAIKDQIQNQNLDDRELAILIRKAEYALQQEREALEKEVAQQQVEQAQNQTRQVANQLNGYFRDIANAPSVNQANASINQALTMFSASDAPVLIVISQDGMQKDYDRPTTIVKYLHYLKDQKRNPNMVENIVLDSAGKIKKLELLKR